MKWSYITALGAGSLVMALLALFLAASALPQALTLDDPTASVSEACAKGQVAQCAKDRQRAKNRVSLMFNAAGLSLLGCVLLGGLGTLALAKHSRDEQDKGGKGPLLLGPKWKKLSSEEEQDQYYDDLFRR